MMGIHGPHIVLYNLPENQCMSVRGFRVVRILNIWPMPRGLAGPASDVPELDIDPESNTGLKLISIPAETEVGHSGPSLSVL